jgi:uncharacterized protein (DUF362 family)
LSKNKPISRREFIRWLGMAGAGAALTACAKNDLSTPVLTTSTQTSLPVASTQLPAQTVVADGKTYLAVARGESPAELTRRAVEALGGMQRFVKNGNEVIIKPNICTDYQPFEYAATTNPEVVAELVKECLATGARRVRVMDAPFGGTAESAYHKSGIADAVTAAGGQMEVMNPAKFAETPIPQGVDIKSWWVYQEVLNADVLINVPIAKHHSSAGLTLGCKNLMGTLQMRDRIHENLHQRIADITSLIRPDLTVVDAYRILAQRGPTGGDLNDVKLTKTIIASHDIVAADAFACTLFGKTADDIGYIKLAARMGIGTKDLSSIKIEELAV